jgi:hypothetical protein
MLHQIQEYQHHNHSELVRVVTASKMIQRECRRAEFAKEAALLLQTLELWNRRLSKINIWISVSVIVM